MDWDKLRVFYNVADSGSFTRAAMRLDITQSAISRQIGSLEERMGVPLFHRHARGLLLTEQGELLFRTAREVFSELAMVQAKITENIAVSPSALKIAATVGFGTTWLSPRLHTFLDLYPNLRVTLLLSDNPIDLTVHESDVSITSSVTEDEDLIYRELMCRKLLIYSSRDYLLKYGVPLTPEDLDHHRLVVYSEMAMVPSDNVNWILTCGTPPGIKREPYLEINNLTGITKAVEYGAGIACLPEYVAKKYKGLVQILPETMSPIVRFYFVYPKQLKDSTRITNLWTFLREESQKDEEDIKRGSKP